LNIINVAFFVAGAINDLKFLPRHPHLLLTGSKDYSIRLWNIRRSICVAIFSGICGHRDEVLTIDISPDGKQLISGGIDHNIMVWSLDSEEIQSAVAASETYHESAIKHKRGFPSLRIHFPEFKTRDVHGNYVDSVKWFGGTFLTKSCENSIVWWKVHQQGSTQTAMKLFTFEINECDIWFMRMELDPQQKFLAVGSQTGKIFIFQMDTEVPVNKKSVATHAKCNTPIRQIAFSRGSGILIAACDDGTIWRWDKKD